MAFTFYPWIVATEDEKEQETLMNHERIHLQQQKEMFILPFYIIFILNGLYNLVRYWDVNRMYRLNMFESEAYAHELEPDYLKIRKKFSWFRKDQTTRNWIEVEKSQKSPVANKIGATILIVTLSIFIVVFIMYFIKK